MVVCDFGFLRMRFSLPNLFYAFSLFMNGFE